MSRLLSLALVIACWASRAAARRCRGSLDRRGIDHLDAGFRPVRLPAADLQGQDRHRGEGDRAGHRPGARHRAARRCRRGVRSRQGAGGKIPRRGVWREALRRHVQRLRADRAEDRSRRRQGQGYRDRAEGDPGRRPRRSSRAATGRARTPPSSRCGSRPASTSPPRKAPGIARSGRAWGRRSTPPAR